MRFHGNEICCCSYACLNAMQEKNVDVQLFEISTSVPFGIRHYENEYFDRLLTTYCNPNEGIDKALNLWGYDVERCDFEMPQQAIEYIKEHIRENSIVLGPLDMGNLQYQAVSSLFKRMDHYITLKYHSKDNVLCYDSEGFYGCCLSYLQLEQYIGIEGVLEAKDKITIRSIKKKKEICMKDILEISYKNAFKNLENAELENQGSKALIKCYDFLKNEDTYKWRLSLAYDIEYLMQRKYLFNLLIGEYDKIINKKCEEVWEIKSILKKQQKLFGNIYYELKKWGKIEKTLFYNMSKLEERLALYKKS